MEFANERDRLKKEAGSAWCFGFCWAGLKGNRHGIHGTLDFGHCFAIQMKEASWIFISVDQF